jgi:hypothetical protein
VYILVHKQHSKAMSLLCYTVTAIFFLPVLCTQTSISTCDPKGSRPAEGCNVSHFGVYSVLTSTLYTLTCTLHPSAKQNQSGLQIDTDVCVHSPEKWLWFCKRGGLSLWGVVCAPVCTCTWWCVIWRLNSLSLLTFMMEVRGIAPEILVGPTKLCL